MTIRSAAVFTALSIALTAWCKPDSDNRLVLLHTNDTHSQITPNDRNLGGVLRRQVLIDSVRAAERNVLLIDAGDAVQGTLYFSLFGGEVERKLMNELGYDIQILGNHEFDNGLESLAEQWSQLGATRLSTNYNLKGTPLEGLFVPYVIRDKGGKRIAFIGLNLKPEGMIAAKNCEGVEFLDVIEAANSTAWHLKHNEGADMVVAVTHIGYSGMPGANDVELARKSSNIDIIIGGHSHTLVSPDNLTGPASKVANAVGDSVIIAQNGKGGQWLGEIVIDLNNLTATSHLLPVDVRLDDRINPATAAILEPYRHSVDSILNIRLAKSPVAFAQGSPELLNWVTDLVDAHAGTMTDGRKVDLTIMNKGGIRCGFEKGVITKGVMMQMLPFDNKIELLDIRGEDLLEALGVMASRGGDCVSRNVRVVFDPDTRKVLTATVNGKPIDPDETYLLATIDYLANGGDYMKPLTNAIRIASSPNVLYEDVIHELTHGKSAARKFKADTTRRMSAAQ